MSKNAFGVLFVLALLLSGCGGGGGGGSASTSTLSISGVAATGAAISLGSVEAKCATGTGTATTNADGTYTVSVTNGAQPCILRATDPVTKTELHSIVEAGATTANITPVTNLVVSNALGDEPATAFTNFNAAAQAKVTSANINTAVTRVQALTAAMGGGDADMTGIDFMKGSMQAATADAAGDATDKKIDALMAALAAADKKITDLTAQVKTLTSTTNAASALTSVVGSSQYSLSNCPYARSGDIWVLDLIGTAPAGWNLDFNNMRLKNLASNTTYAINLKRDSSNQLIPCAFTASVGGQTVEYRVSTGGVGVWINSSDFGITVPAQKSAALVNPSFAGTYPAMACVKGHTNSLRLGLPFRFEIKADGSVDGYTCDLTKALPDCTTTASSDNKDPVTCTAVSNGTLSCTSLGGIAATAVLYVNGSQASMFMAVTNMPIGSSSYGGLIAMTKAVDQKLPAVGKTAPANQVWIAGVAPGSTALVTSSNLAAKVESVNTTNNSIVSSYTGSTLTTTSYMNTPATGFEYSLTNGTKEIAMATNSWGLVMAKSPTGTNYDGWYAGVKMK